MELTHKIQVNASYTTDCRYRDIQDEPKVEWKCETHYTSGTFDEITNMRVCLTSLANLGKSGWLQEDPALYEEITTYVQITCGLEGIR